MSSIVVRSLKLRMSVVSCGMDEARRSRVRWLSWRFRDYEGEGTASAVMVCVWGGGGGRGDIYLP